MTRTMLAVGLLAACPAKDETTTPGTTSETPTTPPPTTPTPTTTTPFDDFAEADLTNPDVIVGLASASAPQLFALHYGLLSEAEFNSDVACPVMTESEASTTYVGNCTDSNGVEWFGSAVVKESKDLVAVTFSGFGNATLAPCTKTGEIRNERLLDGTLALADVATVTYATSGTFTAVDLDACTGESRHFLLDYAGVTPNYGGAWAGVGTYGDDLHGRATVETVNVVLDNTTCSTEALTGITSFVTSTDDVAILYDGALDCDAESTAVWLLNGVSQGELAGVG